MENSIVFKSRYENYYAYDGTHNTIVNIHPIIIDINDNKERLKSDEFLNYLQRKYSLSEEECKYYLSKYFFLKKNKFFKSISFSSRTLKTINEGIIKSILSNCKQIVFQVTNICNFNCKYCCYGDLYENSDPDNVIGDKTMTYNTAKALIDYMATFWDSPLNQSIMNEITIGFYGGEPLINFDLIQKIVYYVENINLNKSVKFSYSMTTNGYYLDKYMDFLVEKNFSLLVSLDGNKNDNYLRITKNNLPTYEVVFGNLKKIQKKYPEYFKQKIQLNSVLNKRSSPDKIFNFLYKEFNKKPNIDAISPVDLKHDRLSEFNKIYKPYLIPDISKIAKGNDLINKEIGRFFSTHLSNSYRHYSNLVLKESNKKYPTGTCLPFMKKMYILSSGEILACERIGLNKRNFLGYIKEDKVDIAISSIVKKYNSYYKDVLKQCVDCHYSKFCQECFLQFSYEDGKYTCHRNKSMNAVRGYLSDQISTLEIHRDQFFNINKIIFG